MTTSLARLLDRSPPAHIRWGLERTRSMLDALGRPHLCGDFIHIAGTNGKGSTAACAESILRARGCRTGLYTSPHLVDFSERIRVEGIPADRGLLEDCASVVLPLAKEHDASFFEATTVLAFEAFRRSACKVVVAEVGLGGRLDSTNVIEPSVCVITSVDFDHTDYLGDTLAEIAKEKAGILKPGVPAVLGDLPLEALGVVLDGSRRIGVPVERLGHDFSAIEVRTDLDGTSFTFQGPGWEAAPRLHVPLIGHHQAANAALAVRAVQRYAPATLPDEIAEGLAAVRWPGRFEVIHTPDGPWVLDLAHNEHAASVLAELLGELPLAEPVVLLVAILGDKSWGGMLTPLMSVAAGAVFTIAPSSPSERRWNPAEARAAVDGRGVEVETDFDRALERARELAGFGTVVVTGSAHTAGDARKRIRPQEDDVHAI